MHGGAVFRLLGTTFKRFNDDRCFRHSIVISYFALLCAVPLAGPLRLRRPTSSWATWSSPSAA